MLRRLECWGIYNKDCGWLGALVGDIRVTCPLNLQRHTRACLRCLCMLRGMLGPCCGVECCLRRHLSLTLHAVSDILLRAHARTRPEPPPHDFHAPTDADAWRVKRLATTYERLKQLHRSRIGPGPAPGVNAHKTVYCMRKAPAHGLGLCGTHVRP